MAARCSVPLDEERARLAPILPDVVALGVPVSIDTMKAAVAAWALDQGAAIVNDVWGLQRDPDMARVVAARGAPVIIMHNRDRADPAIDIVADVTAFFERSLDIAARAGIARERIVLDPGIGFGKTPEQSLTCIARLDAMARLRLAAPGRRFAQALHPFGRAVRADGTARRLDRRASSGGRERRRDRPRARRGADRAGAGGRGGDQARTMSDAIFVNGLVLHAYHGVMPHEAKVGQPFKLDLMLDIDLGDASRTDKLKDTVSYETLVKIASEAFCARRYRLVEAAAGAVADAVLDRYPQIRSVARHRAQAACADRGDLRRCRRDHRARARSRPRQELTMAEAFIALGGNVGDVRSTFERAIVFLCDGADVRLTARSSDYRTPPWGVTEQPPFVNAVIAVATIAPAARACSRAPSNASARSGATAPPSSAGARAPSISTSSPMTISSLPVPSSPCRTRFCSSALSCSCRSPRSRRTA